MQIEQKRAVRFIGVLGETANARSREIKYSREAENRSALLGRRAQTIFEVPKSFKHISSFADTVGKVQSEAVKRFFPASQRPRHLDTDTFYSETGRLLHQAAKDAIDAFKDSFDEHGRFIQGTVSAFKAAYQNPERANYLFLMRHAALMEKRKNNLRDPKHVEHLSREVRTAFEGAGFHSLIDIAADELITSGKLKARPAAELTEDEIYGSLEKTVPASDYFETSRKLISERKLDIDEVWAREGKARRNRRLSDLRVKLAGIQTVWMACVVPRRIGEKALGERDLEKYFDSRTEDGKDFVPNDMLIPKTFESIMARTGMTEKDALIYSAWVLYKDLLLGREITDIIGTSKDILTGREVTEVVGTLNEKYSKDLARDMQGFGHRLGQTITEGAHALSVGMSAAAALMIFAYGSKPDEHPRAEVTPLPIESVETRVPVQEISPRISFERSVPHARRATRPAAGDTQLEGGTVIPETEMTPLRGIDLLALSRASNTSEEELGGLY